MSEHTQGPYFIIDEGYDDGTDLIITSERRQALGKTEIASIPVGFNEPFEKEQRANAELFAAAPETAAERDRLREALERIAKLDWNCTAVPAREIAELALAMNRRSQPIMSDVIERIAYVICKVDKVLGERDCECLNGGDRPSPPCHGRVSQAKAAIRVVLEDQREWFAADSDTGAQSLRDYAAKLGIDLTKPEEADNGR